MLHIYRFNLSFHGSSLIFVLNLAFCDLIYCSFHLPTHAVQFFSQAPIWGNVMCIATSSFRGITAYADWMSVGIIAVSRCLSLKNISIIEQNGKIFVSMIWIYSIGLRIIPMFINVSDL